MLKQHRFQIATGRGASALASISLSAFLVFGNAVSAFGNAPASSDPRPKAKRASASATSKRKVEKAQPASDEANGEVAEQPSVKTSAPKPAFTKVGEPFVVATADFQQSSPQTPAQRDATRPPGTEQQQPVPPTARPNPPDPRTPPGTQKPAPQTPPGVQAPPATNPPSSERPTTAPSPAPTNTPLGDPQTDTTTPPSDVVEDPTFPAVEPRPVPPLPSLVRIGVVSGDPLSLSLNEAIRRALENNNDIEVARADVRLAEQSLIALRGVFDPVFTYSPQINNSIRPVTNIFGGADSAGSVTTTDYNSDFLISKQFGRGGGNFAYFFNNTRENTSASNTNISPFYSAAQGVQFTQPLWRNRSIDRNRQQIRIQAKRLEQSDADFRLRTIAIISQVQGAYWDLVFALRDEQNQIANLNLARENFRRTEASVAAGASAPLERAEIQTELSTRESSLLLANQQVSIAENSLKELLIKDPLSADWSKVLMPTDEPTFTDAPVSLETALKEARDNRPEMRRLKLQGDINSIDLQFFKNQTKPRVDLIGTIQTNGLAGTPRGTTTIPDPDVPGGSIEVPVARCTGNEVPGQSCVRENFVGGYGQTLKNVFSLGFRQVVVGVTIEIPIRNRTAKANLATAQIQREQLAAQSRSQEQTIEVEVRNAVQSVETARRRVLSARQARASAEEQLSGERRLYQVGRSTTFILFQRENALVNARNQELRAETDYNKALAELQRATSATLRANNIIVDSPYAPESLKD
jgi:HAE1 family hydrophobic/amphiphilic exporter-1